MGVVEDVLFLTGDQGPPGVSPPFNSTEVAGDRGNYGPPGPDGLPGPRGDPGQFVSLTFCLFLFGEVFLSY